MTNRLNKEILLRIGDLCQKTRQSRRISLHIVESHINIKERILSKIEDGSMATAGMAPVYVKAYIKKYCDYLQITDAVPLNELIEGEIKETPQTTTTSKKLQLQSIQPKTQILAGMGAMLAILFVYWVFSGAGQKTDIPIVLTAPAKLPLTENGNAVPEPTKQANNATGAGANAGGNAQITLSLPVAGWVRIYDENNAMVGDGVYEENTIIATLNPTQQWRILSDNDNIIAQYQHKTFHIAVPVEGTPLGKLTP